MTRLDQSMRLYIGDIVVNMIAAQAQRDDLLDQVSFKTTEVEQLKRRLAETTEGKDAALKAMAAAESRKPGGKS